MYNSSGNILKQKNSTDETTNPVIFVTHSLLKFFAETTRTGSAQFQQGITIRAFLEGLSISFTYFLFQVVMFLVLRMKFTSIYQPNVFLRKGNFQSNWVLNLFKTDNSKIIQIAGLDAYFMIRYLKTLTIFFFLLSVMNLPMLLPIHYRKTSFNKTLEMLNMSNIESEKLTFHFIACIFTVILLHFLLYVEISRSKEIINDNINSCRYQTKLLVCQKLDIIRDTNEKFSNIGVTNKLCYIPRNYRDIYAVWKRIYKLEENMEKIIFQIYLEMFYKKHLNKKSIKQQGKWFYHYFHCIRYYIFYQKTIIHRLSAFIPKNSTLPQHLSEPDLLPSLTEDNKFLRNRYRNLEKKIKDYRNLVRIFKYHLDLVGSNNKLDSGDHLKNVAILTFKTPFEAKVYKNLIEAENKTTIVFQGLHSYDIIWSNVESTYRVTHLLKSLTAYTLSIFVIVGWIIPVALVALLSQIPYVALLFQNSKSSDFTPDFFSNIVTTILPVVTLIILTEAVPFIFRFFSYLKGYISGTEIEKDTQRWFFAFLFVHLFLVVTISSGVSFVIENVLDNPTNFPTLLAQELPKSSNFFCSFVIMRGVSYAGGNFLRIKQLSIEIFRKSFQISSPHKKLKAMRTSLSFQWGSIYPIFTILGCITIIYSVIAPLILPLSCISFTFVNLSFQYMFLYQFNSENKSETYGKLYLHGLIQLYAGMYFLELCLLGLISIGNRYDLVIYMLILIIGTAVCHSKFIKFASYDHSFTNPKNESEQGVITWDENYLTNCIQQFQFPNINYNKNLKRIWIPWDKYGIAEEQEDVLHLLFGIICDIDKCYIDENGCVNLYN
ncbi:hypothetical protein C6P44_004804 [Monosporozyma unispora]|nr:hypothetical protein C6P44_004804 [Kazachstania unispora]